MSEQNQQATENTEEHSEFYSADAAAAFAQAPWDHISTDGTLPEQFYSWKVLSAEPSQEFKDDPDEARIILVLSLEILAPDDYKGFQKNFTFFVGTEDDPKGKQDVTWKTSIGAQQTKALCLHCGVDPNYPVKLKNKTFSCFTRNSESNGRKFTNLQLNQIYHTGTGPAPGTAAPQSPRSRYRNAPRTNVSHLTQAQPVDPNRLQPCPKCKVLMTGNDIVEHIKKFRGHCDDASVNPDYQPTAASN